MTIVFGSQLWRRPDDYVSPPIDHPDPMVMTIARILMNANPDITCGKQTAWEYQMAGAMQDSEYYAEPYRYTIAQHIEMAVRVKDDLLAVLKGGDAG